MADKYTDRYMQKLVKENGFTKVRTKGDHTIYKKAGQTAVLSKNINRMVAKRLEKEILGLKKERMF